VARCYRLIESAAQWLLRVHVGVETADIAADKVPDGIAVSRNRSGQLQAGLYAAWQLVAALTDGEAARLFREQGNTLLDYLKMRNGSILAHGFTPLTEQQWKEFARWIETQLLPAFIMDAGPSIIRTLPPQLPVKYPFN
ncbi:MAG: TIGR02710 family CRISPR-associated protein, partial [Gammaproteobacteria bacterium]|nr:TIGR02710 family CRISPR-associated protein [Gammaproteobacteria bacterium]